MRVNGLVIGAVLLAALGGIVWWSNKDEEAKKVFEARATSKGHCGNIAVVMPSIIDALLRGFPGVNGRAEQVETPFNIKC